jgi:multicomponent Na+:H+ antiporter subunit B
MKTLILRTTTHLLIPLLLLFSVFMLLRGHDSPGGGFIGALLAAGAFAVYMMAFGTAEIVRITRGVHHRQLIGLGLAMALASAVLPMAAGRPLFTAMWIEIGLLGRAEPLRLGTPLLFDLGVYLTVLGAALTVLVELEEDT